MFHLNKSCRTDATFLLLIVQRPGPCLAHRPQKAFDGITASRLILPPPPLPGSTFWSQLSRSLISPPPVKIYFIYRGVLPECMCAKCMQCPQDRGGARPDTEAADLFKQLHGCWKLQLGPLEDWATSPGPLDSCVITSALKPSLPYSNA